MIPAVGAEGGATAYLSVGKRVLDVALVLLMLPVAIPVGLLIGLAILITDGRPVLYRSPRIGAAGEDFSILKFRTMVRDSDVVLDELRRSEPAVDREFDESRKLRRDPRITRLGQFLRRSSLD